MTQKKTGGAPAAPPPRRLPPTLVQPPLGLDHHVALPTLGHMRLKFMVAGIRPKRPLEPFLGAMAPFRHPDLARLAVGQRRILGLDAPALEFIGGQDFAAVGVSC